MQPDYVAQGVDSIRGGRVDEGVRLLKYALGQPTLPGNLRAVACLWLAECATSPEERRSYCHQALAADPANPAVRDQVDAYLTELLLPSKPAAPPLVPGMARTSVAPPVQPAQSIPSVLPESGAALGSTAAPRPVTTRDPVAAIHGGPNGPGTGFFVSADGLLATTRYVVGGEVTVTLELHPGDQRTGYVLRAFPQYDLAIVYVERTEGQVLPPSSVPAIAEGEALSATFYGGVMIRLTRRATRRALSPYWFPTDLTDLPDAGGGPVLDASGRLVGMMTRNASSTSSYLYGLHVAAIQSLVDGFRQEAVTPGRVYCAACGHYGQAAALGGHYCENCGAVYPSAVSAVRRRHEPVLDLYLEPATRRCPHCQGLAGFHRGMCLRCGRPES